MWGPTDRSFILDVSDLDMGTYSVAFEGMHAPMPSKLVVAR